MTGREPKDEPDRKRGTGDVPAPVPAVCSEELLRGGRQLEIVHGNEVYRLVLTRNNKLILQK